MLQFSCGCVKVCKARTMTRQGCTVGCNHCIEIPKHVMSALSCQGCAGDKSAQHKMAIRALKEYVHRTLQRNCFCIVELGLEQQKQSSIKADMVIMADNAAQWQDVVVVEIDPPGHFDNPDARRFTAIASMSAEQARDAVMGRDEKKEDVYKALGVVVYRMDGPALRSEQECAEAMRTALHERLQKAGLVRKRGHARVVK